MLTKLSTSDLFLQIETLLKLTMSIYCYMIKTYV